MTTQKNATQIVRQRIMIVEDNHAIARAIQIILQREGYETKWCEDETVYREVHEWRPDLILMDLKMPRLDGSVVTQTLKADPEVSTIPIIIVTADNVSPERLAEIHANDMLAKPFQVPRLLERIRYWILQNLTGRSAQTPREPVVRTSYLGDGRATQGGPAFS